EAMLRSRTRPETCLSDLVLDRLIVGELAGSDAESRAREHLALCDACRSRKAALDARRAGFEDEIFVSAVALKTERAAKRSLYSSVAPVGAIGAISAIAAAVLTVVLVKTEDRGAIRTKGALDLSVVARHLDGRTEQIFSGAPLSPGEAIRFEVSTKTAGY